MPSKLTLSYDLTSAYIDEAKADLMVLLSEPGERVELDFAQVQMMDSQGLAVLATFLCNMQEDHPAVSIAISGLQGMPAKLFAMTKLVEHLPQLSLQ